ncbi:hypothetical protein [Kitasatospora sp. NPDC057198]|uniref:hypothetical protein n=1 Tax=Kitasatospora sp. NPDC057198 TaxID=3346046 RepID=UPI00362AA262
MADPTTCRVCGALVDNYARHRTWHEALEERLPGLEATAERIRDEKRASQSNKLHGF